MSSLLSKGAKQKLFCHLLTSLWIYEGCLLQTFAEPSLLHVIWLHFNLPNLILISNIFIPYFIDCDLAKHACHWSTVISPHNEVQHCLHQYYHLSSVCLTLSRLNASPLPISLSFTPLNCTSVHSTSLHSFLLAEQNWENYWSCNSTQFLIFTWNSESPAETCNHGCMTQSLPRQSFPDCLKWPPWFRSPIRDHLDTLMPKESIRVHPWRASCQHNNTMWHSQKGNKLRNEMTPRFASNYCDLWHKSHTDGMISSGNAWMAFKQPDTTKFAL